MNDITATFGALYRPIKSLVIYQQDGGDKGYYIESYDMDSGGFPINAHPLSVKESIALASALDTAGEMQRNFLRPLGLMPKNVLHINPAQNGHALWYTPAQRVSLYFTESLAIPCGTAAVPPLVWKATKDSLWIYALNSAGDISEQAPLFNAPFFNLYRDGKVCMGTVKIDIPTDCLLEEFMQLWQQYFFKSYFSHLIDNKSPVRGNIIQLWQSLIGTDKKFPVKALLPMNLTLKRLFS